MLVFKLNNGLKRKQEYKVSFLLAFNVVFQERLIIFNNLIELTTTSLHNKNVIPENLSCFQATLLR